MKTIFKLVFCASAVLLTLYIKNFSSNLPRLSPKSDVAMFQETFAKNIEASRNLHDCIAFINGKTIFHSEKIDENSQFFIASVSKQFTACLILMILHEKNGNDIEKTKKALQCPLWDLLEGTTFLKKYSDNKTKHWLSKVSLHMLLTHTSGLENALLPPVVFDMLQKSKNTMQLLHHVRFNSKNMNQYVYSEANYVIIAKIVEALSGQDFAECLKKHIIIPLKLSKTQSCQHGTFKEIRKSNPNIVVADDENSFLDMRLVEGSASMISSAKDLETWTKNLHSQTPLMGKELCKIMITAHTEPIDSNGSKYAYGLVVKENGQNKEFFHHGNFKAFGLARSFVGFFDKQKILTVFLTNNDSSLQFLIDMQKKSYNILLENEHK